MFSNNTCLFSLKTRRIFSGYGLAYLHFVFIIDYWIVQQLPVGLAILQAAASL